MSFNNNNVNDKGINISDEPKTSRSISMLVLHNHRVYYLTILLKVLHKLLYKPKLEEQLESLEYPTSKE
uniref:Uncharacterized protein n=1 Tax=Solanum tuberosum TaxID=4113 RepID=M1CTC2_SOLTU